MEQLKIILIGAGNRGVTYTDIMADLPEKYKVVGVAEPICERREYIKNKHNVPCENCFDTWEKVFEKEKFADAVIISTMDRMHFEPAKKAIEMGYDILLEKPVTPTPEECQILCDMAEEKGTKIMVCHVLRYTPYFIALKNVIKSGKLGRIMSMNHIEEVGIIHQSHSFVRGNWGNSDRSSCMILQKSCHDTDIMQWLIEKDVSKVQSFGSLTYFTKDNAPQGSPDRCIDGCPHKDTCIFNAVKLYYDDKKNDWFRGAATSMQNPTDEDVEKALRNTQYGKCVYKCDNNVVDHQTVNLEFEDGATAVFTMNAFCKGGRKTTIYGTKGQLYSEMDAKAMHFYDFQTGKTEEIPIDNFVSNQEITGGHGGGDTGIVCALYDYLTGKVSKEDVSEISVSTKNHMISFAAEDSRISGKVINLDEYNK